MVRFVIPLMLITAAALADETPAPAPSPSSETPTPEQNREAADHFDRGRIAFNQSNFEVALSEYRAAYALTRAPFLVFNIAQTLRVKGDKRLAIEQYKKYIELDPTGPGVKASREYIVALEAALREEAAEANRRADADRARKEELDVKRQLASDRLRHENAKEALRREEEAERRRTTTRYLRFGAIATGGTGVIALAASAYFGHRAASLSDEVSSVRGMWTEEAQAKYESAESSERAMYVLLVSGGALAVTGGVLLTITLLRHDDPVTLETKRVGVVPTKNGATLVVGGRF